MSTPKTTKWSDKFCQSVGIEFPIIAGPMYPCSNVELIAAVSEAGGIGIVQPISLTYVYGDEYSAGLQRIKSLTNKPIGMNALIEKSSKKYHERMQQWIDISLEHGIRFFVTSLGKPDWVVDKVHAVGGLVYHDVTEKKWAKIGLDCGVDGLICVNNRAGGHAGGLTAEQLQKNLSEFDVPLVCAGGIASHERFNLALENGYAACQLGTRFIASEECQASEIYKQAIVKAREEDIVLSEKITGIPVSIINTKYIQQSGLKSNWLAKLMLRGNRSKHLMRLIYGLKSIWQLKRASLDESGKKDYWQAGKSVADIDEIKSCQQIINEIVGVKS